MRFCNSRQMLPGALAVWAVVLAAQTGAWCQPRDRRIVVAPSFLDTNGNRISDRLEVKVDTGTLVGPADTPATAPLAAGLIAKPVLTGRTPSGDFIICFDHPPTAADTRRIEQLGGEVLSTWRSLIYGMHVSFPGATVSDRLLLALAQRPGVTWVDENSKCHAHLYYSTRQTRARTCWTRSTSVDGDASIRLAVADTGLDGTQYGSAHPDFTRDGTTSKIVAWSDQVGSYAAAGDQMGHGTHCGGIMAGTGYTGGLATGNGLISRTTAAFFNPTAWYYYATNAHRMPINTTGLTSVTSDANMWWNASRAVSGNQYFHEIDNSAGTMLNYQGAAISSAGQYRFTNDLSATMPNGVVDFAYLGYPLRNFTDTGYYTSYYYVLRNRGRQVAVNDGRNLLCGMAPQCDLVGVRILDQWGSGTQAQFTNGMTWLQNNCQTYNIVAVNLSVGWTSVIPAIDTAVNNLVSSGVVACVSAGNDRGTYTVSSPGSASYAITVAADSELDKITDYSSYGASGSGKPDVTAPGGSFVTYRDITSVDTGDSEYIHDILNNGTNDLIKGTEVWGNDYTGMQGTSMACPHVTGLVGLVADARRLRFGTGYWSWNLAQALWVKSIIMMTCTETNKTAELSPNPTLERATNGGKDLYEGCGRINADAAVSAVSDAMVIDTGYTVALGSVATDPKCWARYFSLKRGAKYTVSMSVPSGCDADLYLYSDTPDATGNPVISQSSTTATSSGNTETLTRPVVTYGSSVYDTYYVVVKLVSGSGTMNVTGLVITPAEVSSLAAEVRDGRPLLSWQCGTRGPLAGFSVYSASTPAGPWALCNDKLIAARAGRGNVTYEPHDLRPGQTRCYRLMAVDNDGAQTDYGFVKLTAPRR